MEDDTVTESMREVETEDVFISECDTYNGKVEVEHIDIKEEHSADINENRTDDEVVPNISLNPTCVNSSTQPNHLALFKRGHTLQGSTVIEVSGTSTPENCSNGKETNPDAFAKRQLVTFPASSEETENLKDPIGVDLDSDRISERVKVECNSCDMPVAVNEEVLPETTHGCDIFSVSVKEEIIDIKEECSADINIDNPEKEIISHNRNTFHRRNDCNTSSVFEVSGTSVPEICSNGGGKVADLFVEKELVIFPASSGETNTLRDIVEVVNTENNSCNISIPDNRETLRACDTHSDSVKDESIDIKEECSEDNPENEIPNDRSSDRMDGNAISVGRSTNETLPTPNSPTDSPSEEIFMGIRIFPCNICGKLFAFKHQIIKHRKLHEGVFSCDLCGKSFVNKNWLFVHAQNVHAENHSGVQPFCCSMCGKLFYKKDNLINHEKTHTVIELFACDICGKSFRVKSNLSDHIKIHLGDYQFSCNICGKAFFRKWELSRHKITHTQKPFSCKLCKKSFRYKNSLEIHERTHSRIKPFSCSTCGKSYYHRYHLTRHEVTHRQFTCDICGKCFSVKDCLLDHLKIHL